TGRPRGELNPAGPGSAVDRQQQDGEEMINQSSRRGGTGTRNSDRDSYSPTVSAGLLPRIAGSAEF
ncbi:MAG TPA: hypothetical protein VG454_12980, partial [Gemmatimonadales bacterium]|nr:hypothetical protein [Gemmatimonadales bacterium]